MHKVTKVSKQPYKLLNSELFKKIKVFLLKNLKFIFIVACCIFLFLTALSLSLRKQSALDQMNSNDAKYQALIPTPTDRLFPTQVKPKSWILKKKENGGLRNIFTLCEDCYATTVLRWRDWLFYSKVDYANNQNIQIFSYNLTNDSNEIIFDMIKTKNDSPESYFNIPQDVSDMKILGDTLYFSLGGYLMQGGLFAVDLPVTNKPIKLTESRNAEIHYWKDLYWLIGGEGDSCWGIGSFSLINLSTKQVKHITDSAYGCYDGEEVIDIDNRKRMIMAFHTQDAKDYVEGSENGIYQYVHAIHISDPSIKEGIIARQNMPQGISFIKYLSNTDQLLLIGKKNYIFDFASNSLNSVEKLPEFEPYSTPVKKNIPINEQIQELQLPSEYLFVYE